MSTYELDDDLVRAFLATSTAPADSARKQFRESLRDQLPLPTPTNIGAIVITDKGRFVRWNYDSDSFEPWIEFGTGDPHRNDQIGRVTDVPFEGIEPK